MVIYLFPRGSNSLIIVIDNKSLYMTVKTLNFKTRIFFFFFFSETSSKVSKSADSKSTVLSIFIKLSAAKLLPTIPKTEICRRMRDAGRCSQERGMEGRGVDVDLPLAFQAQRMPQSAKKITEHRSGAVAAATNTNGNPKSVYFCSCRCCCCRFLGSAALCCILQIQFKYKVSSLFFVFPLSLQTDRQTDSEHLV